MTVVITRDRLAEAVARSSSWTGVMRRLGLRRSTSRRRTLIEAARVHGLDTSHFEAGLAWAGGLTDADPRIAKRRRAGLEIT